jgi:hypothetical protein
MPPYSYKPKVDRDWRYEQVRSEINRLREVLHSPNLTAEERAIAQSQLANHLSPPSEAQGTRRSTRILMRALENRWTGSRNPTDGVDLSRISQLSWVPLSIAAWYPRNSWVTLEVSNLDTGRKSTSVRAKVRFDCLEIPELYCVGSDWRRRPIFEVEPVPED